MLLREEYHGTEKSEANGRVRDFDSLNIINAAFRKIIYGATYDLWSQGCAFSSAVVR